MQSHSLIIKEENFLGMEKRMRKNGKKIRLLGVATLLASQLGVFSSALTVVADETTASTSEPGLVTNTSSEEGSTNSSTSATTTTTEATTRASRDKEEPSSSSSDDTEEKTVKIGEIQGEAQRSPLEGQKVAIKNAVVTKTDRYGFYAQDIESDGNSRTSDGIYVVSKYKVKVGDKVKITGTVKEGYMEEVTLGAGKTFKEPTNSLTVTMLVDAWITKDGTAPLPEAVNITAGMPVEVKPNPTAYAPETDALDYWESLEGMLTVVKKPHVLGPQYKGDIYVLGEDFTGLPLNNIGGLNLRPHAQNTATIPIYVGNQFVAKAKDYFTEDVTGVVTYRNSFYKLEPTQQLTVQDGGLQRQAAQTQPSEDKLTIASYNIENFSANNAKNETPEDKVTLIANSFIHEIHNPDIITLIEVQDNNGSVDDGTTSGLESGRKLANRIKELGGKSYEYTEVAPVDGADGGKPGSNIRLGILYNPERVSLAKKEAATSNEAAQFDKGHLVKNPARIAPNDPSFDHTRKSLAVEFEFKGQPVVVIANHLKSKIGDDAIYGASQPAVEHTLPTREAQASVIHQFVQEGLKQNPKTTFVLTGDFNDYDFSTTAQILAGSELTNLMAQHDAGDRYSYFYRGSNQVLDNIFISNNMAAKARFEPVHINASFMKEHGRASDHDPVLVQIDFSGAQTPGTPTDDQQGNTGQATDQTSPSSSNTGSQLVPHQAQANEQKSSTSESKEKGKNEDEKQDDKEEATTEIKTPGKRKILPSTGQETSYLALFGVAIATMSLVWYKKKKTY